MRNSAVPTYTHPHTAYNIPLTNEELKQLGEITAIFAQIEYLMQEVVMRLLKTGTERRLKAMRAGSIKTNNRLFFEICRERLQDQNLRSIATSIYEKTKSISEDRHDFVHAIFGTVREPQVFNIQGVRYRELGEPMFALTGGGSNTPRVDPYFGKSAAWRIKTGKHRPTADLPGIVEKAAKLTLEIAHLQFLHDHPERKSPFVGTF